jgi:TOTE conflict system primase-like protein
MGPDVERFARLFRGRTDAWGTDIGSCRHEEVNLGNYDRHLDGAVPFGVYPLLDDATAWWGCTDIDQGYDMIALAANVFRVFKALGIPAYVEKSRSKGFHVWVFFTEPVSADIIRKAFLFVHQVADVPPKEINPKAATLDGIVLGNYVRAPYVRRGAMGTQVMLDMERADRCPLSLHKFLETVVCVEPSAIEAVAARYVPPPAPTHVAIGEYQGEMWQLTPRMQGLTYRIFTLGPLDGSDRSSKLMQLCYLMHDDGFTADEALALLTVADANWGKFAGRPDCETQLQKMIDRAYG